MELDRKKAILIKAGYWLLVILAVYVALRYMWGLLLPFLLGFVIAYALRPAAGFISRNSRVSSRWASIVAALVFYAFLALVLWLLWIMMFFWVEQLSEILPAIYTEKQEPVLHMASEKILGVIGRFFPRVDSARVYETINSTLVNAISSVSDWVMGLFTGVLKAVPMALLTLVFTILSSVLICADYGGVTGFVMRQIPQRHHLTILEVRDYLAHSLLRIIKTYLILMVIMFLALAAGLWILKIENFVAIAAVIAFLDLLPVLGSGAVLVPWGIVLIMTGKGFTGTGLLLLWAAVSILHELLEPRILGRQIGLHPLATLTAMYLGLKLAGFGGLVLMPVVFLLLRFLQEKGVIRLYRTAAPDSKSE